MVSEWRMIEAIVYTFWLHVLNSTFVKQNGSTMEWNTIWDVYDYVLEICTSFRW